ncbi:MAG: hypothetical protein GY711_01940 [bacterium]|nr:hypothetical protein [bacterium]
MKLRKSTAQPDQSLVSLRKELESQRQSNQTLHRQLAAEVQTARRAAEQVLDARAEREEYRRVLAAAIANEKQALQAAERSSLAAATAEEKLRGAVLARGSAEGRATELELRVRENAEHHVQALKGADDRNWANAEGHARRLEDEVYERGRAEGHVRELIARIPGDVPPSMRVARTRARLTLGAAALSAVCAAVFLPAASLAMFSAERAEYLELATGLNGWTLVGLVAVFLGVALALASWGIRDLKGSERAALEATLDKTAEETGYVVPRPKHDAPVSSHAVSQT